MYFVCRLWFQIPRLTQLREGIALITRGYRSRLAVWQALLGLRGLSLLMKVWHGAEKWRRHLVQQRTNWWRRIDIDLEIDGGQIGIKTSGWLFYPNRSTPGVLSPQNAHRPDVQAEEKHT